jgi:hypothetical protein
MVIYGRNLHPGKERVVAMCRSVCGRKSGFIRRISPASDLPVTIRLPCGESSRNCHANQTIYGAYREFYDAYMVLARGLKASFTVMAVFGNYRRK